MADGEFAAALGGRDDGPDAGARRSGEAGASRRQVLAGTAAVASALATPQKYPRAGSQNYPSPAAEAAADGSTTVWFGPEQPEGVARGNWIQTDPEKGWFTILRLYRPLPSFFEKSWRPSEIEPAG